MTATLLAGLAVLAGFNAWMDPYSMFSRKPAQTAPPGVDFALFYNTQFHRLSREKVEQAEIVLVGESRAHPLTEGVPSTVVRGRPVLNLAFPSASLEEALTPLAERTPRLRHAKLVVSVVSLQWFGDLSRPNRVKQSWPMVNLVVPYLLNGDILNKSFTLLRHPETASATFGDGDAWSDELMAFRWQKVREHYDEARVQRRIALLRSTMEPLRKRGVKVLLWAPPLRPDMGQKLVDAGLLPVWNDLVTRLNEVAPVVDLTFTREIHGTALQFKDPVHHQNGPLILQELVDTADALR